MMKGRPYLLGFKVHVILGIIVSIILTSLELAEVQWEQKVRVLTWSSELHGCCGHTTYVRGFPWYKKGKKAIIMDSRYA